MERLHDPARPLSRNRHFQTFDTPEGRMALKVYRRLNSIHKDILACVRDNGCSGTDCFCGDAALPSCFSGGGNGPCKNVVLAAPGGREPTLDNPSGGPASDAALEVGECADDDDGCADVCDVGL